MPQALDEPLRVVPLDELGDEHAGLLEAFEVMEVHALLLECAHEPFGDAVALGLPDVGRRDGDAEPLHRKLPRFRGHPIVGAERSIHDAEEPSAVRARVPAADR